MVELTRTGLRAIAAASPILLSGVRKHVIDRLDGNQPAAFSDAIDVILDPLDREQEQ